MIKNLSTELTVFLKQIQLKVLDRVTAHLKKLLLVCPCLLRVRAFGLEQLCTDKIPHMKIHLILAKMPV